MRTVRKSGKNMQASKLKIVYVITSRGTKKFWNRVGVAFINGDGSLNVRLDAIPVSGEMHIRDYVPKAEFISANDVILEPTPFDPAPQEHTREADQSALVPTAVNAN
jgi:hypothetical protein